MCRSIKPLFNFEPPATDSELQAAAVQFVRKVSGLQRPSRDNAPAFEEAVEQITASLRKLVAGLQTKAAPRNREIETAKARALQNARTHLLGARAVGGNHRRDGNLDD